MGWNKWWIKGRYNNRKIKFKTATIRSGLCDYSGANILVKETIAVPNTVAAGTSVNKSDKKVIFKSCDPFTDCITEINNTQVNDAQKIHVVMPM